MKKVFKKLLVMVSAVVLTFSMNVAAAEDIVRPHLLLQRGGHPALSRAGQCGHDRRADARHGHSAALHELRRFVAHRLYDPVVYRRAARRLDAAVFHE